MSEICNATVHTCAQCDKEIPGGNHYYLLQKTLCETCYPNREAPKNELSWFPLAFKISGILLCLCAAFWYLDVLDPSYVEAPDGYISHSEHNFWHVLSWLGGLVFAWSITKDSSP